MLHFFCAFMAEAQPIKDHFHIHHKQPATLFACFSDSGKNYSLIITGPGKINAAAAAAYACSEFNIKKSDICMNVGIAGHLDLPIGSAVLIDKITQLDEKTWYPQILFSTQVVRKACLTLDAPSSDYSDDVFDMELSALYQIWMRFGISELCHSIKIISDNAQQDFQRFNIKESTQLIYNNLNNIEDVINKLADIQDNFLISQRLPDNYERCLQAFHFTQSQQVILKKLLYRWQSFYSDQPITEILTNSNNSKDFIQNLESKLLHKVGIAS